MLWETAVLNKLHKTNKFRNIRLKEVPQKQPDAHSSLEVIKQEEAKNSKNDCDLFAKYGLEDLTVHLTSISFYSELLRYYDSIKDLVEVDIEQYIHWTGYLFRHCHEKGTKHTEYDHAIEGLKKLNKHLAIRTCMIGHSLSILDVVTISIIRTNQDIWKGMQEKSFEGFENIYRLSLWIEGAMDIKWDIIYGREMKKKNHKSKSHAPKEITGSKEIVQAVKRNNIDKAREILKANPLLVHAVNMKNNKGSLIHIA